MAGRSEIRYTPKHGSWLSMAEIESGAFVRQCLQIDKRFTTVDVRIKLRHRYAIAQ